jgi:hypothetical protein
LVDDHLVASLHTTPSSIAVSFSLLRAQAAIAGYYDGSPDATKAWLTSAKKPQSVEGIMYTTWEGNYSQIEAFEALVDAAARGK